MKKEKKAVAIVLSIFILVILFSFVTLSSYQYIADSQIQLHYENSLKVLYDLEAARAALLWEEANAPVMNNWDTDTSTTTYDSVPRLSGAQIGNDGFYRLEGYSFTAKAINEGSQIAIYVHAFKGTESEPQDSRYLEYINSPSPMYQYAMFSNNNLTFSGANLYDCKGGAIHSNKDIVFRPSGYGVRFNDVSEFSASGTIKYARRLRYPAPHIIDKLDGEVDGMAPAPYYETSPGYYSTTTGELVTPGPYRYWHTDSDGAQSLQWQSYGSWVAGNWGSWGKMPLIWRGEDTLFYGKQQYGSGYYTTEAYTRYLYEGGEATSSYWSWCNAENKAKVNRFYLSGRDADYLYNYESDGYYYQGDVHIKPSTTKEGTVNNDWFEIPGSLPEEHSWDKYVYEYSNEKPVTFYITERCIEGSAGCQVSKKVDPDNEEGWRYMKKDAEGNVIGQGIGNLLEENNKLYEETGTPVRAQDYKVGGTKTDYNLLRQCTTDCCGYPYFSAAIGPYRTCINTCIESGKTREECSETDCSDELQTIYDCLNCDNTCREESQVDRNYFDEISRRSGDQNDEFFEDYTYGSDGTDRDAWVTKSFDSNAQPDGFSEYLAQLADKGIEGAIKSGVEKKEPFLGTLFDTLEEDSPYKAKAQKNGLYAQSIEKTLEVLNAGLTGDEIIAEEKSFYNWKTGQKITLLDINIENLNKNPDKIPSNGIIYSEIPIRLSNAETLPGTNAGGRKAVFTLISEESVYLKGDYNLKKNPDTGEELPWKISNIATKKKVYTLSDNFADPQSPPSTAIYPEYPYVYVNVKKDPKTGVITDYLKSSDESKDGVWINASYTTYKYSDGYTYYQGMDDATRTWVRSQKDKLQKEHEESIDITPNRVCEDGSDSCTVTYNSLFITPYDDGKGDHSLENWTYINADGKEVRAEKNMVGAFLDFYDPQNPDYDDEYKSPLDSSEGAWDYYLGGENDLPARSSRDNRPLNYWYVENYGARVGYAYPNTSQGYDDDFPNASPTTTAGVLGFTGGNSWRTVSAEYFSEQTAQ